jgi:hypothetical protein
MRRSRKHRTRRKQAGTALLIAIFALLLISVVGIALLVSTSADSALAGNYRTATGAYYGALAGLEEARGRLLWKNPDYINKTSTYSNLLNPSGVPTWGLTQVLYIINGGPGETVDPTSTNPANYPDTEYAQEFPGWGLGGANVSRIPSVSGVPSASLPGPSYKWVRINPVTEQSLNVDVNGDGSFDGAAVLFYDPANANSSYKPTPGLMASSPPSPPTAPTTTAVQALEITALAVLPNGSQKILQYVVAPLIVSAQVSWNSVSPPPPPSGANFPAALTLAGNGVNYTGPETSSFLINGQDQCATNHLYYSVGYTNNADSSEIIEKASLPTPPGYPNDYQGYPPGVGPPPAPSKGAATIGNVYPTPATALIAPNWLTPASLDSLARDITRSADVVIDGVSSGPAHGSNLPAAMSPSTPMTVVVNGDLDLTSWHNTGYGLLLVTGTFTYDPDATWEGIVLVIGQGKFVSTRGGTGGFDGAVFLAKTRDSSGSLLASLGATSFSQTGSNGNFGRGINYNSCWISGNPASPITLGVQGPLIYGPLSYKVLSFREITQQ